MDLLNGAVSNLCDNHLVSLPNGLLSEIVDKRPGWLKKLRDEAEDFLLTTNSVYECTKATAIAIGDIQSSIRHIIEQNELVTVWRSEKSHAVLIRFNSRPGLPDATQQLLLEGERTQRVLSRFMRKRRSILASRPESSGSGRSYGRQMKRRESDGTPDAITT